MNLKTQNKESLEDAVSNSPDPSKQKEVLEKSLARWEDWEGRGLYLYSGIRRWQVRTQEPAWLLAVVYFALQSFAGSPWVVCRWECSSVPVEVTCSWLVHCI